MGPKGYYSEEVLVELCEDQSLAAEYKTTKENVVIIFRVASVYLNHTNVDGYSILYFIRKAHGCAIFNRKSANYKKT